MNKPTDMNLQAGANFWKEHPADEWTDAVVASMKLGGVDNMFFVSGTELAYYQEAVVKAGVKGWAAPNLITMLHESVALHAAIGSAAVSGKPSVAAAHVDVGTLHFGAAIHSAWRANAPVMLTAGNAPRAFPGSMPGARNSPVQWVQEPRDQGEIVRQYTKADHRMEYMDNPGMIISRLLQMAMGEPKGPVYMTMPREIAMLPLPGTTRFPTRYDLGENRPVVPAPDDVKTIAKWLVKAQNPCIYTARTGADPTAVAQLQHLAELLGVPVMDSGSSYLNMPNSHPLYNTGPAPRDVDVAIVLDCVRPWSPDPAGSPPADAKIVWIDTDPVQSRFKTMEFRADMWIAGNSGPSLALIAEAATHMLDKSDMTRIEERKQRCLKKKKELFDRDEAAAIESGKKAKPDTRWVSYQVGQNISREAIVLNDVTSAYTYAQGYLKRDIPGTYLKSGTSTGGWGSGAAFGAKIAAPEKDVVLISGDGFYMFGEPMPALWSARQHKAPFLTVVVVNASYSTGTTGLNEIYPKGFAKAQGKYPGGLFDPPPNFAKLAESVDCYGEYVHETAEVGPAMQRGMKQVRDGIPAVIAVRVPNLV